MKSPRTHSALAAFCYVLVTLPALAAPATRPTSAAQPTTLPTTRPHAGQTVRCAVIGGMTETGFWDGLAVRFEAQTGIGVEVVATGPKDGISAVFRQGEADVIVMHASDTMLNLVADGYAADPQPWVRNDMVIVGPIDDPAKIKGTTQAVKALQQIAKTKAAFVVHSSVGAQEVLHDLLDSAEVTLDPDHTTMLLEDRQRRVLKIVQEKQAYTLVGRIPFRSGKMPNEGLAVMVQGDPKLRRPFLVAVAEPTKFPHTRTVEAKKLAAFLRDAKTQAWIADFGRGKLDDDPLFFPVTVPQTQPQSTTQPAGVLLTVRGEIDHPLALTAEALAALPRQSLKTHDPHTNAPTTYEGVPLARILKDASIPLDLQQLRGKALGLCLVVEAADGYQAVFSLPELADAFGRKGILLADHRDGKPLDAKEGPLRLIVPDETRPVRWVRQVVRLTLARPVVP